jgi:hypothetical protein
MAVFTEVEKKDSEMSMEPQQFLNNQSNSRKEKQILRNNNFKLYYKAIVIEIMYYLHKST